MPCCIQQWFHWLCWASVHISFLFLAASCHTLCHVMIVSDHFTVFDVQICQAVSPGHPASWISQNYPWLSINLPINILSVHEGAHYFPIVLSYLCHHSITTINCSLTLRRTSSNDFGQTFDFNQQQFLFHFMHFVLCKAVRRHQLTKKALSN